MANRFSRLEAQVIELHKAGIDPSTSQDQRVKKYWAWKSWANEAAHERAEGSTRQTQGEVYVAILPFAVAGTNNFVAVPLSRRAFDANPISGKKATFGWKTVAAGETADYRRNFEPAKAIIRAKGGEQTQISKITGRKYKTKSGPTQQGYVYPFGRIGTGTESAAQKAILAAVKETHSISFKPEVYREVDLAVLA